MPRIGYHHTEKTRLKLKAAQLRLRCDNEIRRKMRLAEFSGRSSFLGEIRNAQDLGLKYTGLYKWVACVDCGSLRWVRYSNGRLVSERCRVCASTISINKITARQLGPNHPNWAGGRRKVKGGYIEVLLLPEDYFFKPMARQDGYLFEHRLIVAKALGRCLHPWEIVHHRKGFAKDDNRYPETLRLESDTSHNQITMWERKLDQLLQKQQELLVEVRLLSLENKQLREELRKCRSV